MCQKPRPDPTRAARAGSLSSAEASAAQLANALDRNGIELTVSRDQQLVDLVAGMLPPTQPRGGINGDTERIQ